VSNVKKYVLFIVVFFLFIGLQLAEPASAATNSYKKIDSGSTKHVQHDKLSVKFTCKYSYLGTKVFPVTTKEKFSWSTYQNQNNKNQIYIKATEYTQTTVSGVKGVPSSIMKNIRKGNEYKSNVNYNIRILKSGRYLYASQTVNGKKMPTVRLKTGLTATQYYWKYVKPNFRYWFY
jgi:hypothetical protein